MTIPTGTHVSYSTIAMKRDVQNFVSNISPTDTPLQRMADTLKAVQTYQEWQNDVLATPAANAKIEGDTVTASSVVPRTMIGNTQQISDKSFVVSRTVEATQRYAVGSEVAYQLIKATKNLRRDMEKVLTGAVGAAAGNSTTARTTAGLECWITTNADHGSGGSTAGFSAAPGPAAPTDGTARVLSEDNIRTAMLNAFTQGGEPSKLMVTPYHKMLISKSFTGLATRMVEAKDKRLTATISVYDSDFGPLTIVPNRFQRWTSGSVNGCAFLLDPSLISVAFLRSVQVHDQPVAADVAAFKQVIAEYSLVVRNERGLAKVADLA